MNPDICKLIKAIIRSAKMLIALCEKILKGEEIN